VPRLVEQKLWCLASLLVKLPLGGSGEMLCHSSCLGLKLFHNFVSYIYAMFVSYLTIKYKTQVYNSYFHIFLATIHDNIFN